MTTPRPPVAVPMPLRHHTNRRRTAAGTWEVARPMRYTSWWDRWREERACRKRYRHCWHPEGMIDWWCCLCSAETEGMPPQRCVQCVADGAP